MKGCFTSSRMFLSALVCAVSFAFRTIMAWQRAKESGCEKAQALPLTPLVNASTSAAEAQYQGQNGSYSQIHKANKHSHYPKPQALGNMHRLCQAIHTPALCQLQGDSQTEQVILKP